MKKIMFFLIVSIFLSSMAFNITNSGTNSIIRDNLSITNFNVSSDDVTSRFTYIYDNDNNKIGADFYVKNNSQTKLRVWYSFSGGVNVFVSYNGGYADLNPGQEEWAATVTVAEPTKAWNSGTFDYNWEPIK